MDSTDESYYHTGYEPKDYLMETCVETLTESLTQQQFPEQRFLEDVDYDDTVLEEVLHNAHRVHVYHYSRDVQDAESVRGGNSHVPVNQCHSHLIQFLKEC